MKDFFRRHVLHNFGIKLLSLALAVGLWLAVTRDPVAEVAVEVPIEFRNIPENLEISTENIPRAQIRVRGPQRIVRRLQPADIYAEIELEWDEAGGAHLRSDGATGASTQGAGSRAGGSQPVPPHVRHSPYPPGPGASAGFRQLRRGLPDRAHRGGAGHDYDQRAAQAGRGGGGRHHRSRWTRAEPWTGPLSCAMLTFLIPWSR